MGITTFLLMGYIVIHVLLTIFVFGFGLFEENVSFFDSFIGSICFLFYPFIFIFYLILTIVYFLNIAIKNICLNWKLNNAKTNLIIYKKENFNKINVFFFDFLKIDEIIERFYFFYEFLDNLNQQNLIVKKTNKSKEEIKEIILQKNSFNFDFDKYFIFVESNKLKEIKQENLIKEFEEKIFNKGIKLNDFGKKIKIENKKTKEKSKKSKEKRLEEILNENNSILKTSNSNQTNLENSIKEIKN